MSTRRMSQGLLGKLTAETFFSCALTVPSLHTLRKAPGTLGFRETEPPELQIHLSDAALGLSSFTKSTPQRGFKHLSQPEAAMG